MGVGKELKIETNVGNMKLTVRRTPDFFVEFIRNGETMLKSKTDVTPATFTTTIDTLFYLPSTAILHKMFCLYGKGCFNKRQGHMKVVVDRENKNAFMNKFSFESTVMKDDRMALEMSVSTMTAPYTFHMNAPYFLPRFFNDINRKTIEATISHEIGQSARPPSFQAASTSPQLSSGPLTPRRRTRQLSLWRSPPTGSSRASLAGISRPSLWATSMLMSRARTHGWATMQLTGTSTGT